MAESLSRQWILLLSFTALLLSLVVLSHTASRYFNAYLAAPREVVAFLDAVDSSIIENESYNTDIAKVKRLEDKVRLGRLLRDIQRGGDALREDLNSLLVGGNGSDSHRIRVGARVVWAAKRVELEGQLRRLDLLRMRFLVVHMGIIATLANEAAGRQEVAAAAAAAAAATAASVTVMEAERPPNPFMTPNKPGFLPRTLTDQIRSKPPLRRLTAPTPPKPPPLPPPNSDQGVHRQGWAGVVQELQRSPLLHKRHTSIEMALAASP